MVLQAIDPAIEGVPYWDLSVASPSIFSDGYMGAASGEELPEQGCVETLQFDGHEGRAVTSGQFAYFPCGALASTNLSEINAYAQRIYPGAEEGSVYRFTEELYGEGQLVGNAVGPA